MAQEESENSPGLGGGWRARLAVVGPRSSGRDALGGRGHFTCCCVLVLAPDASANRVSILTAWDRIPQKPF